jgi:sugar phosphate permease
MAIPAKWRMLLATMICYLFYYTGRQTFGFAIPGIEEELGLSKTQLGWISASLLWAYAVGQAVNGQLGDRMGGRRMMSMGAVLAFVTSILVIEMGLGWRWIFRGPVILLFIVGVLYYLVARDRPEDLGLKGLEPDDGRSGTVDEEPVADSSEPAMVRYRDHELLCLPLRRHW